MAHHLISPPHPGELIREDILPYYGLNITDAAVVLNVTRSNLSNILNGKSGVSPDMAMKIEAAFGVSARLLSNMQAYYDLSEALRRKEKVIAGIERREPVLAD